MTPGTVYHLKHPPLDGQHYFIPANAPVQKNGRFKGLLWDKGAAGRSHKKPVSFTAHPAFWVVAPKASIPAYIPNL